MVMLDYSIGNPYNAERDEAKEFRLWAPVQRTHHDYGSFPTLPLHRMHD